MNMMHVACGRLDAYFEDGFGGPWDVAAGKALRRFSHGYLVPRHPFAPKCSCNASVVRCKNAKEKDGKAS